MTTNLPTEEEIHLVVRIGPRLFKAIPVLDTESVEQALHLELIPITEEVISANAADVDRFLTEEEVPEVWKLVGDIAYDINHPSLIGVAKVRFLSFKEDKWQKTFDFVFTPNIITVFLGIFDVE